MKVEITLLGCGHSAGTPLIGNQWVVCDPQEPRNRRTRPSLYVEGEQGAFIVDTGPDFYNQINTNTINNINCVLYTHYHADHTAGIDDLRHWCKRRELKDFPLWMNDETYQVMCQRYGYLINQSSDPFYPILLKPFVFQSGDFYQPQFLAGLPVTIFEQDHRTCTSLGIRIGNVAYSTDMFQLSDQSIAILKGIDTWIVDAASYNHTPYVHADLATVYALNKKIGARQVYLTHMPPTMDYQTLCHELPDGYQPGYDGLKLVVTL